MNESENDYLNNKNLNNPKIKNDELLVSHPYIICAANWYNDNKEHIHQPKNITKGFVIAGRRHHNCFITAHIISGAIKIDDFKKELIIEEKVLQGFLTSDDRFVDRKEAAELAYHAKQTKILHEILFSEHLY